MTPDLLGRTLFFAVMGEASGSEDPSARSDRWGWLRHPLLLTVVTGMFALGITGVLVPYVTRGWQTHDKELDVKSRIVSHASAATAGELTSIESAVINGRGLGTALRQPAFIKDYRDWRVQSEEVGDEILTYFGANTAWEGWNEFRRQVGIVHDFLAAGRLWGTRKRQVVLSDIIARYLSDLPPNIGLLITARFKSGMYEYVFSQLLDSIRFKEAQIALKIIHSSSVL